MISGFDIPSWVRRRLMGGESHDDDTPERAVGGAIAATVEPMATGGLSGQRRQRCHTTEIRERTF